MSDVKEREHICEQMLQQEKNTCMYRRPVIRTPRQSAQTVQSTVHDVHARLARAMKVHFVEFSAYTQPRQSAQSLATLKSWRRPNVRLWSNVAFGDGLDTRVIRVHSADKTCP